MNQTEYIALAIFVVTYALISFGRVGKSKISLPASALAGGALMILTGIVPLPVALSAISWSTIFLILGMMLLTAGMEATGIFSRISVLLVRAASTPTRFLIYTSLITALLSSIVLNDAVVLILTPVIVRSTRSLGISPLPPLVMEAISANIGSAATEVGNPQNAYIASTSGISFQTFSAHLLPVTLLSLVLAIFIGALIAGRNFRKSDNGPSPSLPGTDSVSTIPMYLMSVLVVAVFLSLFLLPVYYIPVIAMAGGLVSCVIIQLSAGSAAKRVAKGVDWGILLFFTGLFVLIQGLDSSGLTAMILSSIYSVNGHAVTSVGGISLLSAVFSNMVSNVPTVVLLSHFIGRSAPDPLWLALAASSTFAGNATIVGAAANVIVVRRAAREGVAVPLRSFMKYGLPVTVVSLLVAVLLLQM